MASRPVYIPFRGYVRDLPDYSAQCASVGMLAIVYLGAALMLGGFERSGDFATYTPEDYWGLCARQLVGRQGLLPETGADAFRAHSAPAPNFFKEPARLALLLLSFLAVRGVVDVLHWNNHVMRTLGETPMFKGARMLGFHPFYGAAGINMIWIWTLCFAVFVVFSWYFPIGPDYYLFTSPEHAHEMCALLSEPAASNAALRMTYRLAVALFAVFLGMTAPHYTPAGDSREL